MVYQILSCLFMILSVIDRGIWPVWLTARMQMAHTVDWIAHVICKCNESIDSAIEGRWSIEQNYSFFSRLNKVVSESRSLPICVCIQRAAKSRSVVCAVCADCAIPFISWLLGERQKASNIDYSASLCMSDSTPKYKILQWPIIRRSQNWVTPFNIIDHED